MSEQTTIQRTIPIADSLQEELKNKIDEESQVIVHCYYEKQLQDTLIRIWPSTFLIDQESGNRSNLLLVDNISIMPQWTLVPANKPFHFTLYFSGLPRHCSLFDLVEEIPEPGAFIVRNIKRNKQDVYHLYM